MPSESHTRQWKVVPAKPTEAMLEAWTKHQTQRCMEPHKAENPGLGYYAAMLAAAPPPPIASPTSIHRLEPWQFQPDEDTPGLYLLCTSAEQRQAIIDLLKGG